HPDVQVAVAGPGVGPAPATEFHRVIGAEGGHLGAGAGDSGAGPAERVAGRQGELDQRVTDQVPPRGGYGRTVAVACPEVGVEHLDLAEDLCVGDVLHRLVPHHVDHHRHGEHRGAQGHPVAAPGEGEAFDVAA